MNDILLSLMAHKNMQGNPNLQMVNEDDHFNRNGVNKGIRLDFTRFERKNPQGWIFKGSQYFEF